MPKKIQIKGTNTTPQNIRETPVSWTPPLQNISKSFINRKRFIRIIFFIVAITILSAALFFLKPYIFKKESQNAEQEAKDLIEKVSKLVVLPQDETPTIATVSDVEKLKDQPFFANAKNGYKVLIYTNAKKAILYDPFENKIVEIAPVNLGQSAQ